MSDSEGDGMALDPRINTMATYCCNTLKVKADKWAKMINQEENVVTIKQFLEKKEAEVLVMIINTAGQLQPTPNFPLSIKTKAVYFVKRRPEAVKKDQFFSLVLCGETAALPIEQFAAVTDFMVYPAISSSTNSRRWPQVVSEDVNKHTETFKGSVFVVSGNVKGRTLLPFPHQAEVATSADYDQVCTDVKQMVHAVESVVVEWSHQIAAILQKSSAQSVLIGLFPGPLVEIEFWSARNTDLESIVDQLSEPKCVKMMKLLDGAQSSYKEPFKALLLKVKEALSEARDVHMHLKPLRVHFEIMEETEYVDLSKTFPPLFHTICLVWTHCQNYQQPARLVVLLQEVSNLLIQLTTGYISEEIMSMEAEESLERLKVAISVCKEFEDGFNIYKGKLQSYHEAENSPVPDWNFNSTLVFGRLQRLLQRLFSIQEYFIVVEEYMKLEKVEFGGIQGRSLSERVQCIFTEFKQLTLKISNTAHDVLDLQNKELASDLAHFTARMAEFDQRLASILNHAFQDISDCEAAFKVTVTVILGWVYVL
jgi:dynein heavy chain